MIARAAAWALTLGPFVVVLAGLVLILASQSPSWWSALPLTILAATGAMVGALIERHRTHRPET